LLTDKQCHPGINHGDVGSEGNMSYLYPSHEALKKGFAHPLTRRPQPSSDQAAAATRRSPYQGRIELYSAFSVVDDAKGKAKKLSAEATAEFEKASAAAQAKTGKIELYSGAYYAACTFGGLLACVSPAIPHNPGSGIPYR